MIDEFAVKFATEYLDKRFANGDPADLVGMLNHVDYFDRVVMVVNEVNETLKQRPSVYVQRIDGRVVFNQSDGDREITEEDLDRNVQMYNKWFEAQYKALQENKKYIPPEDTGDHTKQRRETPIAHVRSAMIPSC
jgi:hypothetical protein